MPDKVVLRCADTDELLGLMAYIVDGRNLAMEIVYVESVDHSNANPFMQREERRNILELQKSCLPVRCLFQSKMDMTVFWCSRQKRAN